MGASSFICNVPPIPNPLSAVRGDQISRAHPVVAKVPAPGPQRSDRYGGRPLRGCKSANDAPMVSEGRGRLVRLGSSFRSVIARLPPNPVPRDDNSWAGAGYCALQVLPHGLPQHRTSSLSIPARHTETCLRRTLPRLSKFMTACESAVFRTTLDTYQLATFHICGQPLSNRGHG